MSTSGSSRFFLKYQLKKNQNGAANLVLKSLFYPKNPTMKNIAVLVIFLFQTGLTAQTTRYFEFSVPDCGHGNWQDTSLIAATDDQKAVIADVLEHVKATFEERPLSSRLSTMAMAASNHNADH
ncbi:MAG: hypothetical protein R2825_12555 [Saprospiraceae bacterium]